MKKILFSIIALLALTSCEALLDMAQNRKNQSNNTSYNTGYYTGNNHGYNQQGNYNNNKPGNYQYNPANQHVTQQTGGNKPGEHVTQSSNSGKGQYNNNYNNRNDKNNKYVPRVGDIVSSLPKGKVQTVTINGEKLYLINGVYYQLVRTNKGNAYKIVGIQNK